MAQLGKEGRSNNKVGSIKATQAFLDYANNADTSAFSDKQLEQHNRQIDIAAKNLIKFQNEAINVINNPNKSIEEKENAKAEISELEKIMDEEKELAKQNTDQNDKIFGIEKSIAYIIIGFFIILIILFIYKKIKK
ncbi:MAG: hypothetical protein BWY27_01116 [Bacteroidetes bacterium ADurb.Bin234]|nr:MAG: hypothetical protein BWY27_01116 [Bacteroidetes bacterium ADurb.Bin234]